MRRVRLQPPHRMDALLQAAERPPPSGSDDGEFVIVPTLAFSFVDDEGDVCTVSTDAELQEAVRFHESKGLVVRLAVSEGAASGAHVTSWSPRCIDTGETSARLVWQKRCVNTPATTTGIRTFILNDSADQHISHHQQRRCFARRGSHRSRGCPSQSSRRKRR
eukprot:SAG31_NODE_846_length_11539_cov_70.858392_7_plen_163_part_00